MLPGSNRTTAATTRGPAHAPRPASSIPATGVNPCPGEHGLVGRKAPVPPRRVTWGTSEKAWAAPSGLNGGGRGGHGGRRGLRGREAEGADGSGPLASPASASQSRVMFLHPPQVTPVRAVARLRPGRGWAARTLPGGSPRRRTPALQPADRDGGGEAEGQWEGRARRLEPRRKQGGRVRSTGRGACQCRRSRGVQLRRARRWRGWARAPLVHRPDDDEGPADHRVLRNRAVARIAFVVPGVIGNAPVVSHHPQPARRDDDVEPVLGGSSAGVEV